jgi:uncharacterized Fe-S cluster-containing MiaB family protein
MSSNDDEIKEIVTGSKDEIVDDESEEEINEVLE